MSKSGPDFLLEDIHRSSTLNYATGENLLVSKPFEDLRGCNIAESDGSVIFNTFPERNLLG